MMNKLFMIVLSVCCLLMAACGTDNDETPQGFRIVDTDVDLVAGGGTVEVALQAAGELTAVSTWNRSNCRAGNDQYSGKLKRYCCHRHRNRTDDRGRYPI